MSCVTITHSHKTFLIKRTDISVRCDLHDPFYRMDSVKNGFGIHKEMFYFSGVINVAIRAVQPVW